MYIHVNRISGDTPGTLQNINILNHYVGMKSIDPDAIPELRYFPWIIGGMAALALVAAAVNRGGAFWAWTVIMVCLAVIGIYDFYLWEYDYGHNLSPNAPIKIPGASFQPPLFGTRLILNFTAKSYPHIGGILAGIAILAGGVAGYVKYKITAHGS
jgi:copper chaperone NosL